MAAPHRHTLAELRDIVSLTPQEAAQRGRMSVRVRVDRLVSRAPLIAQCAVAGGASWFIAHDLFGHAAPFFAPVAAIVVSGQSYGHRLRRGLEVAVGVAIGVAIGDLFRIWAGIGWWQVALVIAVAMPVALIAGAGQLMVTQAGVQAVVVTTIVGPNGSFNRWLDAVVGGALALLLATFAPSRPFRRPRELARAVLDELSALLGQVATALRDHDAALADQALKRARDTETLLASLGSASEEGLTLSRAQVWRPSRFAGVRVIAEMTDALDRAARNLRVLARRASVAVWRDEQVAAATVALIADLGQVSARMADALQAHRPLSQCREDLQAIADRTAGVDVSRSLSGVVLLAQVRSIVVDLLQATDLTERQARELVPRVHGFDDDG
jgi:uncharacterized membrane protein YgaE (UPF0421/DUF939 family)